MTNRTKIPDCVELKREAQARLAADFAANRDKFAAYGDFLRSVVDREEWSAALWARFSAPAARPADRPCDPPGSHSPARS